MGSIQYTIRSIPEPLDDLLRASAKKSGKSLNQVTLEALAKGAGWSDKEQRYTDLDWFIGSGDIDQRSFDEAMDWLDSLPNDLDANFK